MRALLARLYRRGRADRWSAMFGQIAAYFATRHGERIAADVGIDPRTVPLDLSGVKASFGLTSEVDTLTYQELQKRREVIRKRMEEHHRPRRR